MESLPPTARGRAFIEVPGPANEQPIDCRADIELTWLHRNGIEPGYSTLSDRISTTAPEAIRDGCARGGAPTADATRCRG